MTQEISEIIFGNISKVDGKKLYVKESDFEIPHGEDYEIAIKELDNIQKSSVDGIPFLKLFQYDDFSMWWFIYQSLIPKYKQITNFIKKFFDLIELYHPLQITIEDNYSNFYLIQQICQQKNIRLSYSTTSLLLYLIKHTSKHFFKKPRYKRITKNKIEKRKNLYKNTNNLILDISNKIIFATPTVYRRNIVDPIKGTSRRGDFLQQNIINLLDPNFKNDIIGFDLDYTFLGDHEILLERLSDSISWIPLDTFIDLKTSKNQGIFLDTLKHVFKNKNFQKLFYFKNISLWNSFSKFFDEMLLFPNIPFYLKIFDSLSELFEKHPPKVIFLPYETGPYALSIILASEKFDIKTIGLQHGYIYPGNPMYHYNNFRHKDPLGFPVPSHLLVYGNYVKKMLVEIGYPEENIIIFGNSNFFELEKIEASFDQKSLYKKFKIDQNRKIVLFATGKLQPFYSSHGKYDYDVQIWQNLLNNFKNDDRIFLVLKPHPTEKNISVYENLISKFSANNASIINDNLFELLSISSVTITVFSSVMIDSLCFKKPVIRVKFPEDVNSIFDNSNAVITIDMNSLSSKIRELLTSKQISDDLIKNSASFVKYHYGIPEKDPKYIIKNILKF